jgi:hypothetical protein
MFSKSVWIAGLIGGCCGLLIFELCDLWLGPGFIASIVGVVIFTVVLVILVLVVSRRLAKKSNSRSGRGDSPGA